MERKSLNRPPRSKRPPEVARHVDDTMDAYRRIVDDKRKEKPAPAPSEPPAPEGDRD